MAAIGESSSPPPSRKDTKPVVVRVKRKASQSPLDAFWLEINERPLKRALLDFEKLSIASSSAKGLELKTKKVFVQHVETVSSNEATVDIVQSFVELNSAEASKSKTKGEERKQIFKKENENQRQDQILSKARQKQEAVAKNARFEQIWRRRKGSKEPLDGKLQDMCHFYDVLRTDVEERANEMKQHEEALEDHRMLYSYLPLLREFIPSAAEEIESDLLAYKAEQDEYVFDYYTVKQDVTSVDTSNPFPLVQVDEEDFCDGPDDSEYGSDDSNAENNPLNDYPDELSEEEVGSEDSDNTSGEESDGDSSPKSEELQQDGLFEDEDFLCGNNDLDYDYKSEG